MIWKIDRLDCVFQKHKQQQKKEEKNTVAFYIYIYTRKRIIY